MKPSVADRILQRLSDYADAMEAGEATSERFPIRRIRLNLKPIAFGPGAIKKTRKLLGASQAVIAQLLGVSLSTISSWERGISSPNPVACRFLDEIRQNPEYWLKRIQEEAVQH